jgi:hypothetical protein
MIRYTALFALIVTSVAQASELADIVIKSKDLDDLSNRLNADSSDVQNPEDVPNQLLESILSGRGSNKQWRALERYSVIDDAGASLELFRSSFNALKRNPTLFYSRYMEGDSSALERMADALRYDYSAYEPATPATHKAHQAFFENVLNEISAMRGPLRGGALKRHDRFMERSYRQFENWKRRYEGRLEG